MDDDDEDDSSHGNSEDADDTSESTDLINTVVNIDFEAFPPVDSDFHGIKKLLQQESWNRLDVACLVVRESVVVQMT